jgi:mycothiol synthase
VKNGRRGSKNPSRSGKNEKKGKEMNTQFALNVQFRPATMEDIPPVVDLFNTYSRWQTGKDQFKVEDITNEWQTPNFDPGRDIHVAFNDQGQPVGYIEFWDVGEPHVKYYSWGLVHPDYHRAGIGTRLLEWVEQRALQALPLAPADARVMLHHSVLSTNESANGLFARRGYQHIRSFYRMQIEFDGQPDQPLLPDGFTIRSIQPGEEPLAIRCAFDSFHDHWGFVEEPFENYLSRWLHHIEKDKDYNPELYFIAMHGDEVAGVSLCYDHITEDPQMAWVGTLGVRKAFRRSGLGLALLQHSFCDFYQRGKPRAGLGVDASSLTGATRLYERAGMSVYRKSNTYELELRPGKDLTTQNIGA